VADHYSTALSRRVAILAAIAPDLDASPGSDIYDEQQADASGSAIVMYALDAVANQAFSSTATGTNLDQHAADAGIPPRIGATFAAITVTVSGATGAPAGGWIVPQGTRVYTTSDANGRSVYFTTNSQAVVSSGGTATIACTATIAGSGGNVVVNGITQMDSTPGVALVSSTAPAVLAIDQETDTALQGRIQLSRAVLYSDAAITAAAKGVPGCFAAYTSDPHDGSAHVTVYAAQADGTLPTALQSAVQTAVNGVLVVTTTATVSPFTLVYQAMQLAIAVQSGYDASTVKANVSAAALAYVPTLPEGATPQPGPMWAVLTAQVAGLADWSTTSVLPTVAATQLFRFLAAPSGVTTSQASTGGSLSNGPVYLVYSWLTAGGESSGSAEAVVTLAGGTATQTITVTAPATFPSGATDLKVYASATPGAESYQNQIATPSGTLVLTTIATGGAAPLTTGTLSAPTITVNAL